MEQTQPDIGGAAAQEAGGKEKLFYVNRNGNLTQITDIDGTAL